VIHEHADRWQKALPIGNESRERGVANVDPFLPSFKLFHLWDDRTAEAGTLASKRCAGAQGAQPTNEPPMIAGPEPNTKTPSFKLPRGTQADRCCTGRKYACAYQPLDRPYSAPEAPLSMFRDLHAKIGCDRAVIVNATVHGTDFRVVTDAIGQFPDQYGGVGAVSDDITDQELSDLNKAGIRGCRFAFLKRLGGGPRAKYPIREASTCLPRHCFRIYR
jgi:hypothetical protein